MKVFGEFFIEIYKENTKPPEVLTTLWKRALSVLVTYTLRIFPIVSAASFWAEVVTWA
jgi:hypothetical protein